MQKIIYAIVFGPSWMHVALFNNLDLSQRFLILKSIEHFELQLLYEPKMHEFVDQDGHYYCQRMCTL